MSSQLLPEHPPERQLITSRPCAEVNLPQIQHPPATYWLVVEDSGDDFLLLQRACSQLSSPPKLKRLADGRGARQFLGMPASSQFCRADPLPSLVISDLNMPYMNGLELLAWFKSQPQLRRIPFLLLTNSHSPLHAQQAHHLGADDYLIKPGDGRDWVQIIRTVAEHHWSEAQDCQRARG